MKNRQKRKPSKMKNILITGANSYVGTSFEKWLGQWPDKYHVDTIDMIDGAWRNKSFAEYDAVFHVAGIAHRKETRQNAHLYYEVNRDLAIETAKKAKTDGVRQFIFMSSMSVYGMEMGVITKDTVPNPKSHYGKSKLEAEQGITALADDSFHVAVLRPPMIYGKGCKGNYQKLAKLARITPIFPDIENKRSMIYIDNLSEFVRKMVDYENAGLYLPQNEKYICTSDLVKEIAYVNGKKISMTKICAAYIKNLANHGGVLGKVFGSLVYSQDESLCNTFLFQESIRLSEEQEGYFAL